MAEYVYFDISKFKDPPTKRWDEDGGDPARELGHYLSLHGGKIAFIERIPRQGHPPDTEQNATGWRIYLEKD